MPHAHLDLDKPTGDSVKTTTCYMCACRCGIRVHLKNGRVRYIDGNPQHPVNRGVICAKGSAGIMQHYSPARLSKPLLRIGERSDVGAEQRFGIGLGADAARVIGRPFREPHARARLDEIVFPLHRHTSSLPYRAARPVASREAAA